MSPSEAIAGNRLFLAPTIPDGRSFLASGMTDKEVMTLRRHERTGQPLGDTPFIDKREGHLGRVLRPLKPGPKLRGRPK